MYGFNLPLENINLLLSQADRSSPPYGVPNGCVSSPFRPADRPTHNGIDIAYYLLPSGMKVKNTGRPIYAVKDGVAMAKGYGSATGYYVNLDHQDSDRLLTRYFHMQSDSPVLLNSFVKRGQVIGYVGQTGNVTGPHLHFEIQVKNGDYLDPIPSLSGASPACPYSEPVASLRQGDKGLGVNWVQWFLNNKLGAGLVIDGDFGLLTDVAVRSFQVSHGLVPADGIVGPMTRAALACPYREPVVNLQMGSYSDGVRWLQWYLGRQGYSLVVDGDFGANTHHAVVAFQQSQALVQDGVVGPLTRDKIKNG